MTGCILHLIVLLSKILLTSLKFQMQPRKRKSGYVLVSSTKKIKFLLDSGATHHICNDRGIMRNLRDVKKEHQVSVFSAGGIELRAERIGSVFYKDFKLSQVRLIPDMPFNVVSIGQLASQGLLINTGDRRFSITAVDQVKVFLTEERRKTVAKSTVNMYFEL
uniref:Retrovirus-related Pol polyprotein from transposon TNT 1-94-like beta-barrel domain-containing protein n=1 Tax=Arundo donax TaxID=35708 RepID=A0A0A9GG26_ARUDO